MSRKVMPSGIMGKTDFDEVVIELSQVRSFSSSASISAAKQ